MIFDHRQKVLSKQLEATEGTKEDADEALVSPSSRDVITSHDRTHFEDLPAGEGR